MFGWEEFDSVGAASADYDDRTVREDLVGGVPSALGQYDVVELFPITRSVVARGEFADLFEAVEVAAGLEEGAVGEELAGGAPGVGEDF